MSVPEMTGPATCPSCRREKYLAVKRRYQQSPKGIATSQAREEREDVREKRRQFSRSQYGKINKAKYEATPKGQKTRKKAQTKYKDTPKAKLTSAAHHQKTKDDPARRLQRSAANSRYARTENGKARSRRQHAQRKGAILSTDNPVTAQDWEEILKAHKYRCYYCKKKEKLTMDHVIPLSKKGQHTKENLVPACQSCNSKKSNKLILLC
jgi:5-methylcytosine-specific restriction endonuclease McrA